MSEHPAVAREVFAMQLASARNRIIKLELVVAISSFSLLLATVPASFFGMNLPHGLEVPAYSDQANSVV